MTTKSRIVYVIFIVIIFGPLVFGTSPRPAPYDEYRVTGNIIRQSGGLKQNYVVTLIGYSVHRSDTMFVLRSSNGLDYGVTDTSGYFVVDVISEKVDSLTIAVSSPDKPRFISPNWIKPTGRITLFEDDVIEEPGCDGCGTEVKRSTYIKGYVHTFQHQTVTIPE